MSPNAFNMEPATINTFAAIWRQKTKLMLLRALQDRKDPVRASWWLGQLDACISVLYDVKEPAAYHLLKRRDLVKAICEKARAHRELGICRNTIVAEGR
jgi:hypothetical protein